MATKQNNANMNNEKKIFVNFLKKEELYGYFLTLDKDKKNRVDSGESGFLMRFYEIASQEIRVKVLKALSKYNNPELTVTPKTHKVAK